MGCRYCGEAVYAVYLTQREDMMHTTATADPRWIEYEFRQAIVRCHDCKWLVYDATPGDDNPHFCRQHGVDMFNVNGFCSWGERVEG